MARILLSMILGAAMLGAGNTDQEFTGTISDAMCAMDHTVMRMGPTDAACTQACVEEHDAPYVLADGTHVYHLSDQRAPKAFAGRKVKVIGTLDAATNTITVTSIAGQ